MTVRIPGIPSSTGDLIPSRNTHFVHCLFTPSTDAPATGLVGYRDNPRQVRSAFSGSTWSNFASVTSGS